jgi:two-component system sensor histidine kinase VicK
LAHKLLGIDENLVGQHLFDHIPQETFGVLQEQNIGIKNPMWNIRFSSIRGGIPLLGSVAVVDEKEEETQGLILLLRDISAEQELDHLKSKFLENVSNHLRNPLASLKGFFDLFMEDSYESASARQREYLDVIKEETEKLTEIVEDLLSLSRIELTDQLLKAENTAVSEILINSIINNQDIALEKGISLETEISENLPDIRVERETVLDVVNRLISNAIKYSPPNTRVIVGAMPAKRGGEEGMVEVFVRDFGPGVPEDRRGMIFEKYQEHRLFTDSDTPGVGLGLPICKKLIELNNGHIGVEQAVGGGSRFYFTVPAESPSGF